MDCERFEDLILDDLYGELDATDAEKLREHLAQCKACREKRDRFASVMKDLDLVEPGAMSAAESEAARSALNARMFQERAERPAAAITGFGSRRYVLTAAAVLLAIIGLYVALPYFRGTPAAFGDIHVKPISYELTIFNEDLALVKDRRQIVNLQKGKNVVRFTDVASRIDATSVKFTSDRDPAGTHVEEQNYEYDLADAGALLKRFVNRKIEVVSRDGTTTEGYLASYDLSTGEAAPFTPLKQIDRGSQALERRRMSTQVQPPAFEMQNLSSSGRGGYGTSPGSLVLTAEPGKGESSAIPLGDVATILLPEKPKDLETRPTLVWKLNAQQAGNHETTLAYLSSGFSWNADYVVTVGANDVLQWQGWVTVNNYSGTRYPDAKLKLIAGDVHRAPEPPMSYGMNQNRLREEKAGAAGGKSFEEKAFFEYHMYTLQGKTTLNNNQTKQIRLLSADGVKSERRYVFDANANATNALVELIVWNKEENRLGMPLPKGRVRFRRADPDGEMQYVGEDSIDHTPKDEKMTLKLGAAFDVVGERTQVRIDRAGRVASYVIKVRNHKMKDPVDLIVREHAYGDWRVTVKNMEFDNPDAFTLEFHLTLPPNSEKTVSYTIER